MTSTRKDLYFHVQHLSNYIIIRFVFLEIEAAKVMILGAKVRTHVRTLLTHIKAHLHGNGGNRVCMRLLQPYLPF